METASSYCPVTSETPADARRSAIIGSLSLSRKRRQRGSSSSASSVFWPWTRRRSATSMPDRPWRASTPTARRTSSTGARHAWDDERGRRSMARENIGPDK
jgi:hypothetical protein